MKYSRKEYEKLDDAHVMGKIPQVKDKVKTIQYLCEESIVSLEELKEELNKL